jgi:hypothetical protein
MTIGVVEEGSLPTEPRPETTEKDRVATLWFRIDGLLERFKRAMANMKGSDERGPPDYAPDIDELTELVKRIARDHEPQIRIERYSEGGGNKWDKWAMPGLVTLAVSGIIGNVVQAMAVSALRQEVTDLKAEVERVEKLVEPRYRGG